jgi:DNA mismatch endonuclease (patch repair protein)
MADIVSVAKRSLMMASVRQRHTTPEVRVRSALHKQGYRFTVNSKLNRSLPGKPDIILPRHRTIILVHGCFWHRHRNCAKATTPTSRAGFWRKKFDANLQRDIFTIRALRRMGWRVLVVWECETDKDLLLSRIQTFFT